MPGLITPPRTPRAQRARRAPPPKEAPVAITNIKLTFAEDGDSLTYKGIAWFRVGAQRERDRDWFTIPRRGRKWVRLDEVSDASRATLIFVGGHDELNMKWSDVDLFFKRVQDHIRDLERASDAGQDVACGVVHGLLRTDKMVDGEYVDIEMRIVEECTPKPSPEFAAAGERRRRPGEYISRFREEGVAGAYPDVEIPPFSLPPLQYDDEEDDDDEDEDDEEYEEEDEEEEEEL